MLRRIATACDRSLVSALVLPAVLCACSAGQGGDGSAVDANGGSSDGSLLDQAMPSLDALGEGESGGGPDAAAGNETATGNETGSGNEGGIEGGNDAGAADGPNDSTLAPDGPPAPCPTDGGIPDELRCTGLYGDWARRTVAPDALYYDPGFKLWSDGAAKRRWIRLPPQSQIDTTDMDEWSFPVGTKIWKEFSLGGQVVAGGLLMGGKIIETRLLWKQSTSGWTSLVYRWSDDQSSTHRLDNGAMVPHPSGPPAYEVPSIYACADCHAGRQDFVLGFDLIGLGVPSAGATGGLTLATLPSGWLTHLPPATTVTIPEDTTRKAAPALGLLHMNCGVSCHNALGQAKAAYTGLFTKLLTRQLYPEAGTATVAGTDTYTTSVRVQGHLNFGVYMRILPGSSAQSLMTLMSLSRDPDAGMFLPMPPIVSHRLDTDPVTGIPLVQAWIDALR
jgi:hypothetical protein